MVAKTLTMMFFYAFTYLLINESIKGTSENFIFAFFFAIFCFIAGTLFGCDIVEQIIKKLKQ